MDQKIYLITAALVLFLCVLPASAVIQEVTLKGTVSTLIPGQNILSIENPARYGCDYPAGGDPVCSFTPMQTNTVTGTVPNSMAFTVFKEADTVVATSLGETGGTWIGLAKLYGPDPGEEYVTDIVGDPSTIPTPLIGGYSLDITTTPDCNACSGTTCKAATAKVTVMSDGMIVADKAINPKQSFTYNGRNDGSSIAVTFVEGEAPSANCAGSRSGMTGPQPVSVFIVNVVPPIGFTPVAPTAAVPADTAAPAGTGMQEPVPVPTTKSPLAPFAAIGALGLLALAAAVRR